MKSSELRACDSCGGHLIEKNQLPMFYVVRFSPAQTQFPGRQRNTRPQSVFPWASRPGRGDVPCAGCGAYRDGRREDVRHKDGTVSLPEMLKKKGKKRFPRHEALAVADELVAALLPYVDRIVIAGSLRRRKPGVGDIEIMYIPTIEERKDDSGLFTLTGSQPG